MAYVAVSSAVTDLDYVIFHCNWGEKWARRLVLSVAITKSTGGKTAVPVPVPVTRGRLPVGIDAVGLGRSLGVPVMWGGCHWLSLNTNIGIFIIGMIPIHDDKNSKQIMSSDGWLQYLWFEWIITQIIQIELPKPKAMTHKRFGGKNLNKKSAGLIKWSHIEYYDIMLIILLDTNIYRQLV